MLTFLISLVVLILGYILYGAFAERVFGIDADRPTPVTTMADGVDYVAMPTWRVFLIQFLNIAGLGPIFGAIMGIMFGPAAFIWIVAGTIFGGAVHDFISAMMSVRSEGRSLPELIGRELGMTVMQIMRVFSVVLLILVGAVFVLTPADLLASMTPDFLGRKLWVLIILVYYLLATLLPVDKLIGKLYPVFGLALLFMAAGIMFVLLFGGIDIPDGMIDGLHSRRADSAPVFPMMFVSIACGAISGFHATQSPMMARCLKNERLGRPVFYGAMVAEGIVALIWAAAAIAFTGGYEGMNDYMSNHFDGAGSLVHDISIGWLGAAGGVLALLGVIAAPITTGDTALRSARLIAADFLHLDQRKILKRMAVSIPLFVITAIVMFIDFSVLWRYFAWCNQTLSVFTLWAATVYLSRHGKWYAITLVPAMFMTVVCVSYLLYAPCPEGFGVAREIAIGVGCAVALIFMGLFIRYRHCLSVKNGDR